MSVGGLGRRAQQRSAVAAAVHNLEISLFAVLYTCAATMYLPCFPMLYSHMLAQRAKMYNARRRRGGVIGQNWQFAPLSSHHRQTALRLLQVTNNAVRGARFTRGGDGAAHGSGAGRRTLRLHEPMDAKRSRNKCCSTT